MAKYRRKPTITEAIHNKYTKNNRTEHIIQNKDRTKNIERRIKQMGTKESGIKVTYRNVRHHNKLFRVTDFR